MDPIVIAVIVLAIVVVGFLMMRGGSKDESPSEPSTPQIKSESKPTAKADEKATKADEKPTAKEPTAKEPAAEEPAEEAEAARAKSEWTSAPKPAEDEPGEAEEADGAEDEPPAGSDESSPDEEPAASEDEASEDEEPEAAEDAEDEEEEAPPPKAIESTYPPARPSAFPQRSAEEEVALLKKGLDRTRGGFVSRLTRLFKGKQEVDASLLDEVEEALITADIGVKTADRILTALRTAMEDGSLKTADEAWSALRSFASEILTGPGEGAIDLSGDTPKVILVVGVNGVGKTTTIGKLTARLKAEDKRVLLAAGDTFRAAAVLQLEVWARRNQVEVVKGKDKADPSAVIFDAISKGKDEGYDVVLCDTAGRLHTKSNLMDELAKVGRSAEKALGRPVDEVLLVLDATTGQNAIQQAAIFREALELSGIALTKIDGTAKGGVILGIVDEHRIPVRYLGIGEKLEDLREFHAAAFVEALLQPVEEVAEAKES